MALPKKLKNMNLLVDAYGFAGKVNEVTLPKITQKLEEHRAGGMDAPVEYDMGLEKLECGFSLAEYDPAVLVLFGLTLNNSVPVTVRGYAEDESGKSQTIVARMRGRLTEQDPGTWKPGDNAELKGKLSCTFYSLTIDGIELIHIDIPNMERRIAGVDQLKKQREALGMSGSTLLNDLGHIGLDLAQQYL
jgi:P2 family phage contractile tail tube protein